MNNVELDTVDATLPKRNVDITCIAKRFNPDAVCEASVNDVLAPQPFQYSIMSGPGWSFEEFNKMTMHTLVGYRSRLQVANIKTLKSD